MKKSHITAVVALVIGLPLMGCSDDTTSNEGTNVGDCTDKADNDGDGLFDCDDPGCHGSPDCTQPKDQGVEQTNVDGAPLDSGVDQPSLPPDAATDAHPTCAPGCGTATVVYPDNASPSTRPTHCCNGIACGLITLESRSGSRSSWTLTTCDAICAASTYNGNPMVCAARCGANQGSGSSKLTYCKGGTSGGFAGLVSGGQTTYMALACDKKQPWNSSLSCCCEAPLGP